MAALFYLIFESEQNQIKKNRGSNSATSFDRNSSVRECHDNVVWIKSRIDIRSQATIMVETVFFSIPPLAHQRLMLNAFFIERFAVHTSIAIDY